MVVDYSKWDKLELSDDSDIEVHPNVDKKSFIRWKQRDIHEKRNQRHAKIDHLKAESGMNSVLLKRIEILKSRLEPSNSSAGLEDTLVKSLQEFGAEDKNLEKGKDVKPHQGPSYTDMLASLLEQVKPQVNSVPDEAEKKKLFVNHLSEHYTKLSTLQQECLKELHDLEEEEKKHITSEDVSYGFDSTLINKNAAEKKAVEEHSQQPSSGKPATKSTTQEVEVLNPSSANTSTAASKADEELDEYSASKAGLEYSKISASDYNKLLQYIAEHRQIVSEREKDALLMHAFDLQLSQKAAEAKTCVHNALILQYCGQLGPDGITVFFKRITTPKHAARKAFLQDVEMTYEHIKKRCAVLAQERAAAKDEPQEVEVIQLHASDPNSQIEITVPPANSEIAEDKKKREIFDKFPKELRDAIESHSLEDVNKYLEKIPVSEAEQVVNDLNEGGMLSIVEGIYDATTWQHDKQFQDGDIEGLIGKSTPGEPTIDTVD